MSNKFSWRRIFSRSIRGQEEGLQAPTTEYTELMTGYAPTRVFELPPHVVVGVPTPKTVGITSPTSNNSFFDLQSNSKPVVEEDTVESPEERAMSVHEEESDIYVLQPVEEATVEFPEERAMSVHEEESDIHVLQPVEEATVEFPEERAMSVHEEESDIHVLQPPKKKTTSSAGALKRMFSFVLPDGGRLTAALVSLIVSSSSNLALPYFVGKAVDRALSNGRASSGQTCITKSNDLNFFVGAAGVFAFGAMASYFRTYNFNIISHRMGKRIREKLFPHLLSLDMSFYDEKGMGSGELVHILSEDVDVASKIYTVDVPSALRGCSSAINGSVMLLTISPKLTLCSVGMVSALLFQFCSSSTTMPFSFIISMYTGSVHWCICHGLLEENESINEKHTATRGIGYILCK